MDDGPQMLAEALPLGEGVRLLATNEDGLVALEKPAGLMSHPNSEADRERSLLRAEYDAEAEAYVWETERGAGKAWLLHRLDSPTSGVILLALSEALNRKLKEQFAAHRVQKTYLALVRGVPSVPAGNWTDTLKKTLKNGKRVVQGGLRVRAKARYQLVKHPTGGFPVSLLKLMPVTGRTHQLRIQCKQHGLPIVGDRTYGSFSFNREVKQETGERGMMLHSAEIRLRYAYCGNHREFEVASPMPERFSTVLRFRPGLNHGASAARRPARSRLAGRRFRR